MNEKDDKITFNLCGLILFGIVQLGFDTLLYYYSKVGHDTVNQSEWYIILLAIVLKTMESWA